jgi:hypothetical protein
VAELHVLYALRHEQPQGSDRPSGFASAAPDRQPGRGLKTTLESNGPFDVGAIPGTERRLDVATDLIERRCEGFDVGVGEVRVLSYFCDGNAASQPNTAVVMQKAQRDLGSAGKDSLRS